MSVYAADAGSRYIVRDENLTEAYEWLKNEGEYAHVVGHSEGCTWLGADGCEDMFCGYVSSGTDAYIMRFMELFCESGSYACHHIDEFDEYILYWVDDDGCHDEYKTVGNPFAEKISEIESWKE